MRTSIFAAAMAVPLLSLAQPAPAPFTAEDLALIDEHVYGGLPGFQNVLVRQGYVVSYNSETRTPNWSAYHVIPEYRQTPTRKGRFSSFRADPDVDGEARDSDYVGLLDSRGYARGHLAPYAVMGGDRDDDGQFAEFHENDSSNVGDPDDAETIFEANRMTNIAPQHHEGFNGFTSGPESVEGLWFELERFVQDDLVVGAGREVWVFAGCIFGPGEMEQIGPDENITVPPMFYKIVIMEDDNDDPLVLAFLFPHQRVRHGDLFSFLVTVDVIEAMTGLDFFSELDDDEEAVLEDTDTWLFVEAFIG